MAEQGYRADGAALVSVHLGNDSIKATYRLGEPGGTLFVDRPLIECSDELQSAIHAFLRLAGDELYEWFQGQAESPER